MSGVSRASSSSARAAVAVSRVQGFEIDFDNKEGKVVAQFYKRHSTYPQLIDSLLMESLSPEKVWTYDRLLPAAQRKIQQFILELKERITPPPSSLSSRIEEASSFAFPEGGDTSSSNDSCFIIKTACSSSGIANSIELLPIELWLHILSFLDTRTLISTLRVNKGLNLVLEDDILWKKHFLQNFNYAAPFNFSSWKIATLTHFHLKKDVQLHHIATYSVGRAQFCEFIDEKEALYKAEGFLKILSLQRLAIRDPFFLPIADYKHIEGWGIIAIFRDNKSYGAWLKRTNTTDYTFPKDVRHPIFESERRCFLGTSRGDFDALRCLSMGDSIRVGDSVINIGCIKEGFQPYIYAKYPDKDLIAIGCFPGKVQIYRLSNNELICDYQDKNGTTPCYLSIVEDKLIIAYQNHNPHILKKQLVIYDLVLKQVLEKLELASFILEENALIYSNYLGEISHLDLRTLSKQKVFSPKAHREDFPNHSLSKILTSKGSVWTLCSNGKLYFHNLQTMRSTLLRETKCCGVAPSNLDLIAFKEQHIVLKEGLSGSEVIEIFNIEDLDDIKLVFEKRFGKCEVFCFGNGIVFDSETCVEILRGPNLDSIMSFDNTVGCLSWRDQLIIAFKNGDILSLDGEMNSVIHLNLGVSVINISVFQNYLLYISEGGHITVLDITHGVVENVVFKKESALPPAIQGLGIDLKVIIHQWVGHGNALIISTGFSTFAINLKSKEFIYKNSFSMKLLPSPEGIVCLNYAYEPVVVIKSDLTVEQVPTIGKVQYIDVYYNRFVVVIRSDGSIEVSDLDSNKRVYWKHKLSSSKNLEIKEVGENKIIILHKSDQPIIHDLEIEEELFISDQLIHSWSWISNESVILVLENGEVLSYSLKNGVSQVSASHSQNYRLTDTKFREKKVILFYETNGEKFGETQFSHFSVGAKLLDLETGRESFFSEKEKGFQIIGCDFFSDGRKNYLINSFVIDYVDYNEYLYKILDLKDNSVVAEFNSVYGCQEWILCTSQFILYIGDRSEVMAYNVESKEEVLLLGNKYIENRSLVDQQTINGKIFIWLDEVEPYDSDDFGSPEPTCYAFDPKNFLFCQSTASLRHSSFSVEASSQLSPSLNTSVQEAPPNNQCFDSIGGRLILGTSETESVQIDDDDFDYIEKFSLRISNLKEKSHIDLIKKADGKILRIHCFDSKIYVWIVVSSPYFMGRSAAANKKKLLEISGDLSNQRELDFTEALGVDERIDEIKPIENKVFIKCHKKLYFLSIEGLKVFLLSDKCKKFWVHKDCVLIESEKEVFVLKASLSAVASSSSSSSSSPSSAEASSSSAAPHTRNSHSDHLGLLHLK